MARKPRIHFPGALYHVMLRGNARAEIFFHNDDRQRFLLLVQEGAERFDCRVHAFCLMPNHVHLAIQVGPTALSRLMQNLGFRYTQWINRRYQRVGHLFQGRYKAILIDQDSYLLELVRYVHLNPLRARLVRDPAAYRWSSHRAYLGREPLAWLSTDWVLSQFARRRAVARRRYAAFVRAGVADAADARFDPDAQDGRILGDDPFIERVHRRLGSPTRPPARLEDVLRAVCRSYALDEATLRGSGRRRRPAEARAMVAWLIRDLPGVTLSEAAAALARDLSSLSAAATRLEHRADQDPSLARRYQRLSRKL